MYVAKELKYNGMMVGWLFTIDHHFQGLSKNYPEIIMLVFKL